MTLSLTFHTDRYRVRIQASGLAPGYVRVERSPNGLLWEPVRGATALEVVAGSVTVDDYEYTPGVENHYRVVAAVDETFDVASDGTPWEVPSGIRALTAECWGAGGGGRVDSTFAQSGAGGGAYARSDLDLTPGETLTVQVGAGGAPAADTGGTGGASAVIRANTVLVRAAGGGGPTGADTPGVGGSATFPASVGDVTYAGGDGAARNTGTGAGGGGGGSATASGAGGDGSGTTGGTGEGDGGDGGAAGQPGEHGESPGGGAGGAGDGAVTDTHGGNGRVRLTSWFGGAPEQDTITVDGHDKVILKSIKYPSLNRPVTVTDFSDSTWSARSTLHPVAGRALPVEVRDQRLSRAFTVELMTATPADARAVELMLALGEPLMLHVPPGCPVPGGHVAVADVSAARRTRSARSPRRYWTLPCTLVAPPAPSVTPTTLTWGTVRRLWGDWSALLASNPTWADLLSTVGTPEDPVVI